MILEHKGNYGSVNIDQGIYWGKLLMIEDCVTYEAEDLQGLKREFVLAIEDYVRYCTEVGMVPHKPEILPVTKE